MKSRILGYMESNIKYIKSIKSKIYKIWNFEYIKYNFVSKHKS